MCMHAFLGSKGGQDRLLDALELEQEAVVSLLKGLETKPESPTKEACDVTTEPSLHPHSSTL